MKIKLYIVTYKNRLDLESNLNSLDDNGHELSVFIINNHSDFSLMTDRDVTVLHNVLRPDFSTGHLSRNWNQAIINGFRDLNNPECDLVITAQDDTLWSKNAIDKLAKLSQRFSFVTCGIGDNVCSYRPEAVKNIGLWDERFCNIGYQEADYFLRALIYNGQNSSINDYGHGRVINPHNEDIAKRTRPVSPETLTEAHHKSTQFHPITENLFRRKWGVNPHHWQFLKHLPSPLLPSFVYYPYFEKDVIDLKGKGYILP